MKTRSCSSWEDVLIAFLCALEVSLPSPGEVHVVHHMKECVVDFPAVRGILKDVVSTG